jgi:hypothetical protein
LNERSTEEQIGTFFSKKYVVFDAQQNSLHETGVANSVQLQELLQATTNELINVRDSASRRQEEQDIRQDKQESIDASLLQMVQSKNNEHDGTATTISTMTAHTAVQQQEINDLRARI